MKKKKSNTLVVVLVIIAILSVAAAGGTLAYIYYQNTHVFVEGAAYPLDATYLDLREEDISFAHYNALQGELPGCEIVWSVPFQGKTVSSDATEISITNPSAEDISILGTYFPKLEAVNAAGCDNYEALEQLPSTLPQVKVSYQVALGGSFVDPTVTELDLEPGDYDLDTLKEASALICSATSSRRRICASVIGPFSFFRSSFLASMMRSMP